MNILTILILLMLMLFAFNGYRRGLVKTLASMFFFVIAAVLVYYAAPYVHGFLDKTTPLPGILQEKCESLIAAGEGQDKDRDKGWKQEFTAKEQEQKIEELPLPSVIKKELRKQNNHFVYEQLKVSTFQEYVAGYLAGLLLRILSYVFTFLLVFFLLRMTIMTLDIVTQLPVLKGANQIAGLFFGLLQGVAVVWILFLAVTVFANAKFGREFLIMINDSPILSLLYNSNLILRFLFRAYC